MSIKEKTDDLHTELESLPFNQKMFRGEQTREERISYLASWLPIFEILDPKVPADLRRYAHIANDLDKLGGSLNDASIRVVDYIDYFNTKHRLNNSLFDGHIYLNFMGFMYGGQIMKKRYPDSSSMYEFNNIEHWRDYIRKNYVDAEDSWFVHEVRTGFLMHINISKDLGKRFGLTE